jgi:acetyl esterase/lipase
MKKSIVTLLISLGLLLCGCGSQTKSSAVITSASSQVETALPTSDTYTRSSRISDVISDPVFADYGRLLFPVQENYYSGDTLGDLQLTWYNDINPDKTVEIVNYLHDEAAAGSVIFYDIYTEEEKAEDPDKEDTGLFFFRGDDGADTAVVNAGGGFAYVGAMQDSFPVSLELSKKGYNAFALIYRPGAETACEDLSRAVVWLFDHQDELHISMDHYSLWGGSAGARMAAWVGTNGTAAYGEKEEPQPAMTVTQYTGLSDVTGSEPPTYANVGTADTIADYRTMEERISRIRENGTPAEIEVFEGLPHGFGLGQGTAAEGWVDHAISFWQEQIQA